MTVSDYWEREVYAAEPIAGLERVDATSVFAWLAELVPVKGSRVDWSAAVGTHFHATFEDAVSLGCEAAAQVECRLAGGGRAIHVGDSLSPCGVFLTEAVAAACVPVLLEIPEHHYFVAEDGSWIVAVSFEGYLDVLDLASAH